jgi:hypothetical protein
MKNIHTDSRQGNEQIKKVHDESEQSKEVRVLHLYLENKGWVHVAEILQFFKPSEWTRRGLRLIAVQAHSPRIISGQKGYCRLDEATVEEVQHFEKWMKSQAREMTKRVKAVNKEARKAIEIYIAKKKGAKV